MKNKNAISGRLTWKDFNVFSRTNPLNRVESKEGTLTLFALFFPILVEYLLKQLMSTVSVYIMGRVSDGAVAAIGVATEILNMFILFYTVIATGATVVINQNLGAGNRKRAESASNAAILIGAGIAIVVGTIGAVFAASFVRVMNLEEALVPQGAAYLRIAMGLSIFQAVMTIAMAECRAFGNTAFPVIASLLMNVINAGMSYIVVFRPFETPLHGVSGIAFGRVFAEAVCCFIMLVFLKRVNPNMRYGYIKGLSVSVIKDIFRIGLPSGFQYLSYSLTQAVSTSILATIGSDTLSAKIYVYNIVYYGYLLASALGQANALMAGRLVGQGQFECVKKMSTRNLFIGMVLNVSFACVLACFRYPLLSIFTENPVIIAAGATAMILDIFVEAGRAVNMMYEQSLIAAGDVRFTLITTILSTWGIAVLLSYILGVRLGWGLAGCWIAFALDEAARGTTYIIRWASDRWTTKALV